MKNKLLLLVPILLFAFWSTSLQAAVWKSKNTWSNAWETKYQNWVATNWKPNFFMNPSNQKYYRIPHDCADAIYLMRMVFSYENRLPFVINNANKPTQLLSNDMNQWDALSENQRLRQFMLYINDRVGTRSLVHDTYPIPLSQIRSGDLYVEPGSHSYEIVGITDTGVTVIMSSTTPASPKMMIKLYAYPFFIPKDRKNMTDGYRRFKWPRNIRKPMQQQPGYSAEQYTIAAQTDYNYVAFTDIIAKKLRRRPEPLTEKTKRVLVGLCSFAKERVNYVNDGLNYLRKLRSKRDGHGRSIRNCMNAKEYDYYSTPSRDKRLKRYFEEVLNIAYAGGILKEGKITPQLMARAIFHDNVPAEIERALDKHCRIAAYPHDDHKYINLRQLWNNIAKGKISSDPHAPYENRWGLTDKPFVKQCRTF
ncbi:MAG TPA: hypothetical protein ENJ51_01745 [Leucothrix mucor]|uniref:Uncharacterized protein n=1 Tax=Leucothrix mucor TaxID=45248 RepID=A0A7V2SYT3_LEUMU|nr:hypothetical protein [Leucothrix mucor]